MGRDGLSDGATGLSVGSLTFEDGEFVCRGSGIPQGLNTRGSITWTSPNRPLALWDDGVEDLCRAGFLVGFLLVERGNELFFGGTLLFLVFLLQLAIDLVPLGSICRGVGTDLAGSIGNVSLDEGMPQLSIFFGNVR